MIDDFCLVTVSDQSAAAVGTVGIRSLKCELINDFLRGSMRNERFDAFRRNIEQRSDKIGIRIHRILPSYSSDRFDTTIII